MIVNEKHQQESEKIEPQEEQESHSKSLASESTPHIKVVPHHTKAQTKTSSNGSLKILKSFYKKDALASVTDSFLSIDESYSKHKLNNNSNSQKSRQSTPPPIVVSSNTPLSAPNSRTSSSYSLSSNSTTNHKLISEPPTSLPSPQPPQQNPTTTSSPSPIFIASTTLQHNPTNYDELATTNSCTQFVNKLVEPKIAKLNMYRPSSMPSTSTTFTTIPLTYHQQNHKQLVYHTPPPQSISSSSSSSSYPHSNHIHNLYAPQSTPTAPMTKQPIVPVVLLTKKLRKYLPFNCGLKNHGNTCFMNCVLQSLFHTSPLADFFITSQFEQDIRDILAQQQQQKPNQFVLTRHFHKLLAAMWHNSYEGNYSAEMKHLIGYLNPVFAGVQQNDSHEFCVWLLDRLSSELTQRLMVPLIRPNAIVDASEAEHDFVDDSQNGSEGNQHALLNGDSPQPTSGNIPTSSSFIEELFKIHFKSTVVCSKCGYKSSKSETDMMLSLPLPQTNSPSSSNSRTMPRNAPTQHRQYERRSLYFNLILTNPTSIRLLTSSSQAISTNSSSTSSSSNDLDGLDSHTRMNSRFYINETSLDPQQDSPSKFHLPFHIKIGVNLHLTCDNSIQRELLTINDSSPTVLNPTYADLRNYLESVYKLSKSNLTFLDLTQPDIVLNDSESLKESANSQKSEIFVLELNQVVRSTVNAEDPQQPLINIVAANVYTQSTPKGNRQMGYGLPFAVLINRDCSYPELCRKLLEMQSKYLRDRNMLKYRDLAEKMFTLSLVDPVLSKKAQQRLNPGDELPLYAECIDKALNESSKLAQDTNNLVEHIRLNIEWRSYDDISGIFKDFDSSRAEFIHKTVFHLQKMDEQDQLNPSTYSYETGGLSSSSQSLNNNNYNGNNTTTNSSSLTTLNDCFELFTQCEELSDENSWMCTKCKKQTNAYKKLCISSVPPILIIHLKRFFYKSKTSNFKLTTPVWFPVSNLDMSKYLVNEGANKNSSRKNGNSLHSSDMEEIFGRTNNETTNDLDDIDNSGANRRENKYIYDLFAVCNHKGQNMANGHYTAYCKNPIDTRWYNFDDSTCTPLFDTNTTPANIYNTGSVNVCTENAYILFYKKRSCLRNERWWKPYVDRALYDYDEFGAFLANLDAIERQQAIQQQKHQQQLTQHHQHHQNQHINPKRVTSLKSFKDKLLGSRTNTNEWSGVDMEPSSSSSAIEHQESMQDSCSDFVCERETMRAVERQRQEQILRQQDSRRDVDGYFDGSGGVVNHYDEFNRPKRLLKKTGSKENFPKPSTLNISSSLDSSPVSSSSSSYNPNDKNLINLNDPINEKINNIKAISRDFGQMTIIGTNNTTTSNKTTPPLNNSINNDFIFKYPNDNEYIYTHQQQQQQQQHTQLPPQNTYYKQPVIVTSSRPNEFFYTPHHQQLPPHPYFQQQAQQLQSVQRQNGGTRDITVPGGGLPNGTAIFPPHPHPYFVLSPYFDGRRGPVPYITYL